MVLALLRVLIRAKDTSLEVVERFRNARKTDIAERAADEPAILNCHYSAERAGFGINLVPHPEGVTFEGRIADGGVWPHEQDHGTNDDAVFERVAVQRASAGVNKLREFYAF